MKQGSADTDFVGREQSVVQVDHNFHPKEKCSTWHSANRQDLLSSLLEPHIREGVQAGQAF